MDETQLQNYITQYNSAMTPNNGQLGTSEFQGSPGYQAQFGQPMQQTWQSSPLQSILQPVNLSVPQFMNSAQYQLQYGNNTSMDPNQRFQNDPGIQAAIKAGLPALQAQYAQRGMGASGQAAVGLAQNMYNNYNQFQQGQQNLYNTEYGQAQTNQAAQAAGFLNQQQGVGNNFQNYQGQLNNVMGMGNAASTALANNTTTSANNLMSILAGGNLNTGQSISQANLGTGENIASLLANQGVLNANLYSSTGAAMANNMLNGSMLGAQLQNQQNASNAGSMNSMLGAQGAQMQLYGLNNMYSGGG